MPLRSLTLVVALLAGSIPSSAAVLSFSSSGTWSGAIGPIHAADSFSEAATWDTSTIGASFANFALLLSYSLSMPVGDGFNVASLPDGKVLFAGAHYTSGTFDFIQVNERSTTDNAAYAFFFGSVPGPGRNNADVQNVGPTQNVQATNNSYSTVGPNVVVPEPATGALFGVACVAGLLRLRRRHGTT